MAEFTFVEAFVKDVRTSALREIEIITSGMFAIDPSTTRTALRRLANAFDQRGDAERVRLTLRLSVDKFHADRIGLEPVARIWQALSDEDLHGRIGVYIRSVLVADDPTMQRLATMLCGTLTEVRDFQQQLLLPGGARILVYYKNLIVDGRMSWRRAKNSRIDVAPARADDFLKRFVDGRGKHVPARTYNGPQVEHLDGLALIVEHDGGVKILEGNAPDRVPSLFDLGWADCLNYLYADPLTIFLIEEGPLELASVLQDVDPSAVALLTETNQLYYLADKLLDTPERRLLAMSRVIDLHAKSGRLPIGVAAAADIRERVAACLAAGPTGR